MAQVAIAWSMAKDGASRLMGGGVMRLMRARCRYHSADSGDDEFGELEEYRR